jgi:enoyl-CoA hydratase
MEYWQRVHEGPLVTLTLTWPPINALNGPALEELGDALAAIAADSETRALLVTGGRARAFCSGGDLTYWHQFPDGRAVSRAGSSVFARLAHLDIPTIAAINGHVVGDGLALALACDLRWASERATFRLPELRYGFIPGWGTIQALAGLIGQSRATELLLSGRALDATAAERIGLVHASVPSEQLLDEARLLGWILAALPPAAVRAAKRALRGGDERAEFAAVWGSPVWAEGMKTYLEERASSQQTAHAAITETDLPASARGAVGPILPYCAPQAMRHCLTRA